MNGWFLIGCLGFILSIIFYTVSVLTNREEKYMDQIGPWGIAFSFPISVAALCAGIVIGKTGSVASSKIVFIIIAALIGSLMTKFFSTAPADEEVLFQDPLFGKTDPTTGIRCYLRVKSGKLFGRLPHIVKPKDVTGPKFQQQLTAPKEIELEPKNGPATLKGTLSVAWTPDPSNIDKYLQLKPADEARIKYVTERLERAALAAAGDLAKTEFEGEKILGDVTGFSNRVLKSIREHETTFGIKIGRVICSGMDYDPEFKRVLNDIALAKRLNKVARDLAGLPDGKDFPATAKGRQERLYWLEEAKIATGIGDIRKEIFDVRGLEGMSKEEAAKVATEIFARHKRNPK